MSPGPARLAPSPMTTKIPVPMIAPTPSAVRSRAPTARLRVWCSSPDSAMRTSVLLVMNGPTWRAVTAISSLRVSGGRVGNRLDGRRRSVLEGSGPSAAGWPQGRLRSLEILHHPDHDAAGCGQVDEVDAHTGVGDLPEQLPERAWPVLDRRHDDVSLAADHETRLLGGAARARSIIDEKVDDLLWPELLAGAPCDVDSGLAKGGSELGEHVGPVRQDEHQVLRHRPGLPRAAISYMFGWSPHRRRDRS